MRRFFRGLAIVGLVTGVGYAVFTLTRLTQSASADQFDDYTPTPAPAKPAPHQNDEKPDESDPDEKQSPGEIKPQSNQWGINPPAQRTN